MFQESGPHVQDVKTESNQVTWKDGINTYHLTVNPLNEQAEQGAAPVPSAPRAGPSEGAR